MNFSLFACIDSLDMEKQCLSYTTSHGTKIKPMTGIEEHLYQGMRMRHSIIAGECCTRAHAGLCSWTLDTGWWRLHAGHRGYYRHQTPALPCYAAQPWPPPWLPAPRTRNTQPSHQDTRGDAQPGADAGILATGRAETKPHQGGSDLKCGFPLHLDNWD